MNGAATLGLTSLFATIAALAMWQDPSGAVAGMATAAQQFLAALPEPLRAKACADLGAAERQVWGFVPAEYPGVKFGELDPAQKAKAHALLRSALSSQGYLKTTAILGLENVLRDLEGPQATHRDPGRYALQVFGVPSSDGVWAWRIQGHHLSLHFSIAHGKLASHTPSFLGTNPHELRQGPHAGLRVLGAEEDLARGLLATLTETQRKVAIVATTAPADVILGPARAADFLGEPKEGIAWSQLTAGQQELLWRLIEEYAHNLRGEFAADELQRIRDRGRDAIRFVWAGGTARGQGHYYRVQGPSFSIEYDNTQNDANHVHTVWRDRERDFGGDPLRAHVEQAHRDGK
ncbi:MAG: DUF3500 domain-containing protein [Planctomycetes bacterium]|nr:DUF3500 domain-containing protein [Planctomycetota bacterium]